MTHAQTVEVFPGLSFTLLDPPPRDREKLLRLYWGFHPRLRFFKTLPERACLVDYGAGPGGLHFWLEWADPPRRDLRLIALDRRKGEFFDRYHSYVLNPEEKSSLPPELTGLDAVFLSHVLEHVHEPATLLAAIRGALRPGGRAYFELPTPATLALPPQAEVWKRGIKISTLQFRDDPTHLRTWPLDELHQMMERSGLRVLESGVISMPWFEDPLFTLGYLAKDPELTTYAVWLRTRWCQWLVVEVS